ncbi:MAG: exosortase/archaeosortase family protein [Pirellulales bacterium]
MQEQFQQFLRSPDQLYPALALLGLTAALVWSYWNTLVETAGSWDNPLYSHGYLVPLFMVVLLALRYEPFSKPTMWARWAGLGLLAAGLGMRMIGTRFAIVTVDMVSFVPSLAGLFLLVGGWKMMRWAGPAVAFLVFMFPLPDFVKRSVLASLQQVATVASTFMLQTLGIAAHREGNVINIGEMEMGVVDACSGLRMLSIFVAMAIAIVLVVKRPWWDQLVILLSAVPIALAVNMIRITVTGVLFMVAGESEFAKNFFHDWAGWFMMPLALGMLYVELFVLSKLVIDEGTPELVRVGVPGGKPRSNIPVPGR